jgi:hypothetical protein
MLTLDERVAFTVTASGPDGQPRGNLPAEQRWRGLTLQVYEGGTWRNSARWPVSSPINRVVEDRFEAFDSFALTFTVQPRRAGGLFLADPIRLGPKPGLFPVRALDMPLPGLFFENGGTVLPIPYIVNSEYRYRQIVNPADNRDRYPAERLTPDARAELLVQHLPELCPWTYDLLRRLVANPRYQRWSLTLPDPPVGGRDDPHLLPQDWYNASLLLTEYLAQSGDYTYSLQLQRQDTTIDPVLDFLFHVKDGPCERYAGSLAMLLRSVHVPTRVVRGFRGVEQEGKGNYLVRHSQAHAWVEALIPRADPREEVFDWLVLDPTPSVELPTSQGFSFSRLWQQGGEGLWHDLFSDFNAGARADLWSWLVSTEGLLFLGTVGLFLVGLVVLIVWMRRGRRADRAGQSGLGLYHRLVVLLTRYTGLKPRLGQTPREFTAAVREVLVGHAPTQALADLPGRVVELLYRSRFGGQPIDPEVERGMLAELEVLAGALRKV